MNGKQLLNLLTEITESERVPAKWYARHLHVAGLFPADDEPAALDHAINLLLALAVARCPAEAVEAARLFAGLPMKGGVHFRYTADGRSEQTAPILVENIPIEVGGGARRNEITATVRSALALMVRECPIDAIRAGRALDNPAARWMTVARDMTRPEVDIVHLATVDGRDEAAEVCHILDNGAPYLKPSALAVNVVLSRSILHALADHWSENRIGTSANVRRLKSEAMIREGIHHG